MAQHNRYELLILSAINNCYVTFLFWWPSVWTEINQFIFARCIAPVCIFLYFRLQFGKSTEHQEGYVWTVVESVHDIWIIGTIIPSIRKLEVPVLPPEFCQSAAVQETCVWASRPSHGLLLQDLRKRLFESSEFGLSHARTQREKLHLLRLWDEVQTETSPD